MRSLFGKLVVVTLVLPLLSCKEEVDETWVWGTFVPDSNAASETPVQGSAERPLNGSLMEKGGNYMGSCVYASKRFSFTVASGSKGNLGVSDFYFEINGISGPPSKDPYDAQGVPREDEEGSLRSGYIWTNVGEWSFQPDDIIEDRCLVTLFSEAGPGDLTPVRFGKKPFQYLVKIDCIAGLDGIPNSISDAAVDLNGFTAELWFDNCD